MREARVGSVASWLPWWRRSVGWRRWVPGCSADIVSPICPAHRRVLSSPACADWSLDAAPAQRFSTHPPDDPPPSNQPTSSVHTPPDHPPPSNQPTSYVHTPPDHLPPSNKPYTAQNVHPKTGCTCTNVREKTLTVSQCIEPTNTTVMKQY